MTATITISRDQLAYVLLNLGLATPGERVFTGADEIRAVLSDWLARVNGWRRVA